MAFFHAPSTVDNRMAGSFMVNSPAGKGTRNTHTATILVICFIECLLFGGTLFGWASLAYVLKQEGVLAFVCDDIDDNDANRTRSDLGLTVNGATSEPSIGSNLSTTANASVPGCSRQDDQLSLAFIVGIALFGVTSFPIGWAFDRLGIRKTRCISSVLGVTGTIMLGFADTGVYSMLVFPGFACLCVSCTTVIVTNTYLARLAGSRASTFITLYAGGISSSTIVFLTIKLLYDMGVPRFVSFLVLASLWIPSVVCTFTIIPKHKATPGKVTPEGSTKHKSVFVVELISYESRTGNPVDRKSQNDMSTSEVACVKYPPINSEECAGNRVISGKSLISFLRSMLYVVYVYWYIALHVRYQVFISNFGSWVSYLVNGNNAKVSHYTNVLGYVQMLSIVISPIAGIVMDACRRTKKGQGPPSAARALVALPSIAICNIFAILLSSLVLETTEHLVYFTIVSSELFRSFFYPTSLALLELAYPAEHYGGLFGCARALGGIASFAQYPYTLWSNSSPLHFLPVDIFVLCSVVAALVLPIYIALLPLKDRARDREQAMKVVTIGLPPSQPMNTKN